MSGSADRALVDAVEAANIPTLLMVLVQLTGELRWLDDPYRPTSARGVDDNDSGGLPPERQAEIRTAAARAIEAWRAGGSVALREPGPGLLVRMLSVAMGEPVPDEYGPMLAAELSAVLPRPTEPESAGRPLGDRDGQDDQRVGVEGELDVLVIGAGVSGICAGVRLARAGIPFLLVERDTEVGGTWFGNRYPAAAVDTPSHLYSFSFAPHDWTRYFAGRAEIHEYLREVADSYGVREHIRFGTEAVGARYDEASRRWEIDLRGPDGAVVTTTARVLISAVGAFNPPKIPDLPGLADFAGAAFHTAHWPEGLRIEGRTVAVVGNGASAMQVVPAIADPAAELTVFQRSPHWVAPFEKFQCPIPDPVRLLLRDVPLYRLWYRLRLGWLFNDKMHPLLQRDDSWPHPERAMNAASDRYRQFLTGYITSELGERTDLLPQVLPTYPPGGKRLLLDNGWYRTLTRPDVSLVSEGISHIEPDAVVTADGVRHPADVLVLATGFDVTRFLSTVEVRGRDGTSLDDAWEGDNPTAYLGTVVPGFPNFFTLFGPNVQTGHGGSLITLVEAQMDYVMTALEQMRSEQVAEIEIRRDVHDAYVADIDARHARMVWTHPGMSTYYRNSRGRVVVPTPHRVVDFWSQTRRAELDQFHVFGHEREPASARP